VRANVNDFVVLGGPLRDGLHDLDNTGQQTPSSPISPMSTVLSDYPPRPLLLLDRLQDDVRASLVRRTSQLIALTLGLLYNPLYHLSPIAMRYNPPSPDLPGKPHVPEWIPPATTREPLDYAQLRTIDLAVMDSGDDKAIVDLVQLTKKAIREDGFLFLENYGVSLEQVGQFPQYSYTAQCLSGLSGDSR
jgi:hypothetical protein